MGFRADTSDKKERKGGPRKASGFGMLMIFVVMAVSIVLGWLAPQLPLRNYIPIPDNWYYPLYSVVRVLPIQLAVGLVAFILLQFLVVLLSGFLFPLPPEEVFDKDGFYLGKNKK